MKNLMTRGLLLTILFTLLLTGWANSQPSEDTMLNVLSNQVVEAFDGFYVDSSALEDDTIKIIQVDGYYEEQLVVRKMNRLIDSFSDLKYSVNWAAQSSGNIASMVTLTDEDDPDYRVNFVLIFNPEANWVLVTPAKSQ